MNLPALSIKRPIFLTSIVLVSLLVGLLCFSKLGVDNFPDVTFPVVTIQTPYRGAAPQEIETLVSKPIEEEISSLGGIKRVSSNNSEGVSVVVAEFSLGTDVKYAEQQVRDKLSIVRRKLPNDIDEPIIKRIDVADQPILRLAVSTSENITAADLYDLTENFIKPRFEQVDGVGTVDVIGGSKREIQVQVDQKKLKDRELSIQGLAQKIQAATQNVPVGSLTRGNKEMIFRTVGEYQNLEQIKNTAVNFYGSDVSVTIGDIAQVVDTVEDERNRGFLNGKPALFLDIKKASGTNTIEVADGIVNAMGKINTELKTKKGGAQLDKIIDSARWIRLNVADVKESIIYGIILAALVVYLFLGNFRSTLITVLALPNSLIGAFILMYLMGFTINVMSLLALSLAVGLLIDDAIVVRENIFRKLEEGLDPLRAAEEGTNEVTLAVVATTLTVIAVFLPVGFLSGTVGQFFKQFGLTIVFAMAISLFDALTMAPMLSAYFADVHHSESVFPKFPGYSAFPTGEARFTKPIILLLGYVYFVFRVIWFPISVPLYYLSQMAQASARATDRFQTGLENLYGRLIDSVLNRRALTLTISAVLFFVSMFIAGKVKKTFIPSNDNGEFQVSLEMPPGTSLDGTTAELKKLEEILKQRPEFDVIASTVGTATGDSNTSSTYVRLVDYTKRKLMTSDLKAWTRDALKGMAYARPKVYDRSAVGDNQRPFNVLIIGDDLDQLNELAHKTIIPEFEKINGLVDVDTNYRIGKPEFQIQLDPQRSQRLGVLSANAGLELRGLVEGIEAAKYREHGLEYNIRIRLPEEQRDLKQQYNQTWVPNMNFNLVRLSDISTAKEVSSASMIPRLNRARYLKISGDMAPGGALGNISDDAAKILAKAQLPPGVSYAFLGQAEDFKDLILNILIAGVLAIMFTYLILSSLYESFITPFTIMLALPLALVGAFVSLYIFDSQLNLFSMIGCIMLLGIVTKNSILLVDYTVQLMAKGMPRNEAIKTAGLKRLRPILMTTLALIAGTLPTALGLSEAARSRTAMGIVIIGGLLSSTILTLVVVPAAFGYVDGFRLFIGRVGKHILGGQGKATT